MRSLTAALALLSHGQQTWNLAKTREFRFDTRHVARYLTSIVASPLAWLSDDDKETIWTIAAATLAECTGRMGAGSLTRTFSIAATSHSDQANDDPLHVAIHEPSMTEDNLGLKTWASSHVLAGKHELCRTLLDRQEFQHNHYKVLELGAGTGLVGITIAATCGVRVLLTDLRGIVSNLARNITLNSGIIGKRDGFAQVAVLDWEQPERCEVLCGSNMLASKAVNDSHAASLQVCMIVAADPVYDHGQGQSLAKAIQFHLSRRAECRAIVTVPQRPGFQAQQDEFVTAMGDIRMEIESEQHDESRDDWTDASTGEASIVRCWTTVWKWLPNAS